MVCRLASIDSLQMKRRFGLQGWWHQEEGDWEGFHTSEDPQAVAHHALMFTRASDA